MNRTLIYSLCAITAIFVTTVASRSASSAGQGTAIVRLQSSTPGAAQSGHANLTGTVIAGQFQGGGAGLTGLNASNLASGTLLDARLSANVTLLNGVQTISGAKTFSGAPSFTAAGAPFMVTGTTVVTNLNADQLDGQHGSFYQNAANLTGTVPDARLSANVATLTGAQTFTGLKVFPGGFQIPAGAGSGKLLVSDAVGLGTWTTFTPTGGDLTGTYPNIQLANNSASLSKVSGNALSIIGNGTFDQHLNVVGSIRNLASASVNPAQVSFSTGVASGPIALTNVGRMVYVLTNNYLQVYNCYKPAGAIHMGDAYVSQYGNTEDLAVSGRYAYVLNGSFDNKLRVFDIGNPYNPENVGAIGLGVDPKACVISGTLAYIGTTNGLMVVDIANPSDMRIVGTLAGGNSPGIASSGKYVYLVDSTAQLLKIIDVSNPSAPTQVGSIATGANPKSISYSESFVYLVNRGGNSLQIINVSNPGFPATASTINTNSDPHSISLQGRYVYLTSFNGNSLQTIDVMDPYLPAIVGTATISGKRFNSIGVSGRYAYTTDYNASTLLIFDLTGAELSTLTTHSLEAGSLQIRSNAFVSNRLSVGSGLNVGGSILANGSLKVGGEISGGSLRLPAGAGPGYVLTSDASGLASWISMPGPSGAAGGDLTGTYPNPTLAVLSSSLAKVSGGAMMSTGSSIGIGTASPSELLELRSGGGPTSLLFAPGKWYGTNTANKAQIDIPGTGDLLFWDNVHVNNTLTAGSKLFEIDHPLDPLNKFLRHGCIESDQLKNLYDGTVTTNAKGYATVTVPDWFTALNEKFRYQVTVIDAGNDDDFVMAKITRELEDQSFTLRTSKAHTKVSWQITGVRKDAFAKANPLIVEEEKPKAMQGKYIHPEAFAKRTP